MVLAFTVRIGSAGIAPLSRRGPPRGGPRALAAALALRPRQLRDRPELHEHPEGVPVRPFLDDLAVPEPRDRDAADDGLLAGRLDSHQLALVDPAPGPACGDVISFGELLLDRDARVAKCVPVRPDELLDPLGAAK